MIAIRKPFTIRINRVRRLMKKEPQFSDHYALGEIILKGSQGAVFRAYSLSDSTKGLAVKIVERKNLNKESEQQILKEVEIMRDLANVENSNRVVDFFATTKKFYMVQELAHGGDIFDRVVRHGTYTEDEARELAIKLLTNLRDFHSRGYIHRDLKPENILLVNKSNTSIRVADYGYSDRFDPENLPTKRCGTPAYTAPEVIAGKRYTQAVDMWSAGCILFMILSGRPAFHSKDYNELFRKILDGRCNFQRLQWSGISPECIECIRGLLTVDPKSRFTAEDALASAWLRPQNQTPYRHLPQ